MLNRLLIGVVIFIVIYFIDMSIEIDILESNNAQLKDNNNVIKYETTNSIKKEINDEKTKAIGDDNTTINDGTYKL